MRIDTSWFEIKPPTPSEIKKSGVLGRYFFSRDTLKFFGQTMKMFETKWVFSDEPILKLSAPIIKDGERIGTTRRFIRWHYKPCRCYEITKLCDEFTELNLSQH